MAHGKITYFFVIFQAVLIENKLNREKDNSIITKLVGYAQFSCNQTLVKNGDYDGLDLVVPENYFYFRAKCKTGNDPGGTPSRTSKETRFNASGGDKFAARSAVFDLITGGDDNDDDDDDDDDGKKPGERDNVGYSGEDKTDEEEEEEDDDDDEEEEEEDEGEGDGDGEEDEDEDGGFSILSSNEKHSKKKKRKEVKDTEEDEDDDDDDGTPQLKHVFKHKFKMKDFMYLLLLAYKLKFVTLIPLFLGAVILLVGATSMAGFFFALFSAALGLQSKSHRR